MATKRETSTPVKIPAEAHAMLRELLAFTARHGWSSLGIDREDAPSQTALIEEAIRLLAERRDTEKGKGKKR